jgi:hypothetical protein
VIFLATHFVVDSVYFGQFYDRLSGISGLLDVEFISRFNCGDDFKIGLECR